MVNRLTKEEQEELKQRGRELLLHAHTPMQEHYKIRLDEYKLALREKYLPRDNKEYRGWMI